MPTILKCPNPSCPYQFDAERVPPGAVVACPQCRFQFTLSPTAPPPAIPPTETPGFDQFRPDESDTPVGKRRVIDRRKPVVAKSNSSILLALVAVGAVALLGGGVAFVGFVMGWFKKTEATGPVAAVKFDDYAVAIGKPADGWDKAEVTRAALGVNLVAYKHAEPDGWIAVDAKKFDSLAVATELRPRIYERLQRLFDELDEELTADPATVLGQPGEKYSFRGMYKPTGVGCRGEVHTCVVRNFAYWIYTWAPVANFDQQGEAFQQFRDGITLSATPTKSNFVPQKKSDKAYRSKSGLFTLSDSEGLWTEKPDPTSQDAAAELWLKGSGKSATTGQATGEKADLVVSVLAREGEAKTQARAHILKQVTDGATVDELQSDPTGEAPKSGEVKVSDAVTRLKLTYKDGPTANKLIVFTTLDSGDKRVVAYALCSLKEVNYWEQRMMLIVGTLTGK